MRLIDSTTIPDLPLSLVRRYLAATGWMMRDRNVARRESGARSNLLSSRSGGVKGYDIYTLAEDTSGLELIVPRDQTLPEYGLRIQGVLKTLQAVEDRSLSDVAADVASIGFDVLKSQLPNEHMMGEAIYLDSAVHYIGGLRSLMGSAATTELNPAPFYGRVRKEATAYTERCLFGHTFRGSFGFTIQSPLTIPEINQVALFGDSLPFERRVIQRLARSVDAICEAASTNDLNAVTKEPEVGLSANGLEIFANLVEQGGGAVRFSFNLSKEFRPQASLAVSPTFAVSALHVEVSREAAKILRMRPISEDIRLIGKVVTLRNDTDPTQLMEDAESREVSIAWNSEDFGDIKVRVALNAADYLGALQAHGNGRAVSISGLLEKVGVRWFLREPRDFSIIA